MKITIVNDGGVQHVHKAGCADLKRNYRLTPEDTWTIDADSKRQVVEDVYGPAAGSFYEEAGLDPDSEVAWLEYTGEFRFFGCIDTLPMLTPGEAKGEAAWLDHQEQRVSLLNQEATAHLNEALADLEPVEYDGVRAFYTVYLDNGDDVSKRGVWCVEATTYRLVTTDQEFTFPRERVLYWTTND